MFASRSHNAGTGVILESAQHIQVQSPEGLWKDWMYRGKVHLLAGPPSTGKTTMAMDLAATISTGGIWPDASRSPRGRVVIWSSEDGIEDTVVPRLVSAGADLGNIEVVRMTEENWFRRPFDPGRDLPLLEERILRLGDVALVIIDSIADLMSGSPGNNSKVRKSLLPLVGLAERTDCAVLGLTHVVKASKKKHPLERIIGGVGLGAVVRVAMLVARDDSGGFGAVREWSVLVKAKANICREDGGFLYRTVGAQIDAQHGVVESSRIHWGSPLPGSSLDILNMAEEGDRGATAGKFHQAGDFLMRTLQIGAMPASEVEARAAEAGISKATLRRAREQLGIDSYKLRGSGSASPYMWALPGSPDGGGMPDARSIAQPDIWGRVGASAYPPTAQPFQGCVGALPNGSGPAGYGTGALVGHLIPRKVSPILAPQGEQAAQREQGEQRELSEFELDPRLWGLLLNACVAAYQELRQRRPYKDEFDEYSVRAEAIDEALDGAGQMSPAFKAHVRERLLKEDLFTLCNAASLD